ncbi:GPI-anchored surface protein, putative [Bodo saltans]|uniref:GPI-anchored surface protein, putative n=1 Tax=Bodo saltans TaxID=75058 RepID=A0A0S4IKC9_BODSA|nr:GPI-anchored surface protein, putative [Bodo saltans]|eukprot:CUE58677.1 GPI-anchored surface protein, putative [Bodo saltans]
MRRAAPDSPIDVHAATAPAGTRGLPQQRYQLSSEGAELATSVRRYIDGNNFTRASEKLTEAEVSIVKEALLWQDQRGNTLLHTCVEAEGNSRHTPNAEEAQKLIVFLLRRRANVNAQNNRGETPLHVAAQAGNLDVCRLLHKFQGDLDIRRTVDKRRPEDVAQHFGHNSVFEFLESIRLRDGGGGGSGNSPLVGTASAAHGLSRSTTPRQAASTAPTSAGPLTLQLPAQATTALSDGSTSQTPLDDTRRSSSEGTNVDDNSHNYTSHPITPASVHTVNVPPRPNTAQQLHMQAPRVLAMNSKLQQRFTNDDGRRHKESQENKWKLDEFREKNRRLTTELRIRSLHSVEELEAAERRRLSADATATLLRVELQERAAVDWISVAAQLHSTDELLQQCRADFDASKLSNEQLAANITELEETNTEQVTQLTAVAESLGALRDEHISLQEETAVLKEKHEASQAQLLALEETCSVVTLGRDQIAAEMVLLTTSHKELEKKFSELTVAVSELEASSDATVKEKTAEVERLTQLLEVNAVQRSAEKSALQASWNESKLEAASLREALTSALSEIDLLRAAAAAAPTADVAASTTTSRAPTPRVESPSRAAASAEELAELRGRAEAATKELILSQQMVATTAAQLATKVSEMTAMAAALSDAQKSASRLSTELQQAKSELGEADAARVRLQLEADDLRRIVTSISDGAASPTGEADLISSTSRASMQQDPQRTDPSESPSVAAMNDLKKQLAHEKQQASKRIAQAEAITAAARKDLAANSMQLIQLKQQLDTTSLELQEQISARNAEHLESTETKAALSASLHETRSSLTAAEKRHSDLQHKSTSLFNAEEGRLQLESTIAELRLELSTIRANRQETLTELRHAKASADTAEKHQQRRDTELEELRNAHNIALLQLEDLNRIRGDNAILTAERNDFKRDAQEVKSVFVLLEKDHDLQLERVTKLEEELYDLKKRYTTDHQLSQRLRLGLEESMMRKEVALVQWEAVMCLQQSIASSIMESAVHAFRLSANHAQQAAVQRSSLPTGPRRLVMDPTATMMRPQSATSTAASSLAVRAVSALRSQQSDAAPSHEAPPPHPHPPARPSSATVRRDLEDAELGIAHDDSAEDLVPPPAAQDQQKLLRHNRPLSAALHGRQTHAVVEVLEPSNRVSFTYQRVGPFLYSTSHESVREFYVNQCEIHRVRPIPDIVALLPDDRDLLSRPVAEGGGNHQTTDDSSCSVESVRHISVANIKTLCRSSCRAVLDLFHICPRIQVLDLSGTSSSDAAVLYLVVSSDAAVLYLLVTLEVLCGYTPESPYSASVVGNSAAGDGGNSWRSRLQSLCTLKELTLNGTLVSDVQLLCGIASNRFSD